MPPLPPSLRSRAQQMGPPPVAHTCCWRARCDAGSGSGLTRQSRNTGDESKRGRFVGPPSACSGNSGQRASHVLVPPFRGSVNTHTHSTGSVALAGRGGEAGCQRQQMPRAPLLEGICLFFLSIPPLKSMLLLFVFPLLQTAFILCWLCSFFGFFFWFI